MTVSEYDKILAISNDGTYRIMGPPEKVLLPRRVLYVAPFDEEKGHIFTVVYRDKEKYAYAKLVHIERYIRDKEYELIKNKEGKIDFLFVGEVEHRAHLTFVPQKGARLKEADFDLSGIEYCGIAARGSKMARKPVAKIRIDRR
jgi:hypothetical protein